MAIGTHEAGIVGSRFVASTGISTLAASKLGFVASSGLMEPARLASACHSSMGCHCSCWEAGCSSRLSVRSVKREAM